MNVGVFTKVLKKSVESQLR